MKGKKWVALVAVGAIAASLALFGCSGGGQSSSSSTSEKKDDSAAASSYALISDGKLTVAASLDFPPFENLNGSTAEGFAIDLMNLVAEEMGLQCEYLPSVKFDTIVPMISAGGKADVGVSSFTVTSERLEEIDFTESYMNANQSVSVLKGSGYTSADDLKGKKVAVQSGTTGAEWAAENIEGAVVVPYDEMTAVYAALQSGQADGVVVDLPVAQYYVKNAYTDAEVVQEIPTGEQYAIVVSKDNPELTAALNKALAALHENGKYDTLYKEWFGATA